MASLLLCGKRFDSSKVALAVEAVRGLTRRWPEVHERVKVGPGWSEPSTRRSDT
jgi:hypothetical protein